MTNTQKLEGIKSAKMRKLRERRTTHLVLFQSNHNTFFSNCCKVHLQCSITDPLLKGFLWHYSKPLFPPNRGIFPNSSSGKNKNSIPVNGNTWNYSKPDTWKDSQEVFQQFIRKNVDIKKKKKSSLSWGFQPRYKLNQKKRNKKSNSVLTFFSTHLPYWQCKYKFGLNVQTLKQQCTAFLRPPC